MENDSDKLLDSGLLVLLACAFALMSSFYILLPVLPVYVLHIGGSKPQVGLIIGAFALSALVFRPPVGIGVDVFTRKAFAVVGTVIFTLASASYGLAHTVAALLGVRLFHGSGMASFQTAATTLVVDSVSDRRRGEALGVYGIASNVAMVAAPALGSWLLAAADFRTVFRVSAALAFIAVLLALFLKERRAPLTRESERPEHSLFCREALLPSFAVFALMLTYGATLSFIPLLITGEKLASEARVAVFFSVYAAILIVSRAPAGRISDVKGRLAAAFPGMLLAAVAMVCLASARAFAVLLIGAGLYAVGMALAQPALTAAAVDSVPEHRRGSAMGTFTASFELGIGLGAIAFGALAGAVGYRWMFAAAGGEVALAAIVYGALTKRAGSH